MLIIIKLVKREGSGGGEGISSFAVLLHLWKRRRSGVVCVECVNLLAEIRTLAILNKVARIFDP